MYELWAPLAHPERENYTTPERLKGKLFVFRYALAASRIDGCGTRKDSRLPTPIPAPAGYAKRLNGTRLEHSHWRQVATACECIPN